MQMNGTIFCSGNCSQSIFKGYTAHMQITKTKSLAGWQTAQTYQLGKIFRFKTCEVDTKRYAQMQIFMLTVRSEKYISTPFPAAAGKSGHRDLVRGIRF